MNPLKIGIVEDDLLIAESIVMNLSAMGYEPLEPVRNYTDAIEMIATRYPDLLIIDVTIEGTKEVNSRFSIPFIYLTAYSDPHTVERAKTTHPYAYLVKPFTEKDLYSSIEIAFNNFNNNKRQKDINAYLSRTIFVKHKEHYNKIEISSIAYVESDNVYLNIFLHSKEHYIIRAKLDDFLTEISDPDFVKVHRSYAVNMKYVQSIDNYKTIVNGKEIPISKDYKNNLFERIKAFR
jgi:DNA-binding LytR/AlgR family response regulator